MMELLPRILTFASENKYSDVHINTWEKIRIRNHLWQLETVTSIWDTQIPIISNEVITMMMQEIVTQEVFAHFQKTHDLDTSYQIQNGDRFRVNFYKDSGGYSIAFRLISGAIPTMEEVGLGEGIKELCKKSKGLVLITGPTGSWKSTNLAAMIDYINKTYKKHIITIEDPIEFSFTSENCLINQREVGGDTHGFDTAIRAAMREDPDVIMVWEMRDPETIQAAITLAETGHLVFSTLHTNDSVQTVDRIIDVFPSEKQAQIRIQLSQSLLGIVSQRLLPKVDGKWRIAAREIFITDDAIKNLIITGKTHQIYSVLEVGKKSGMILMDKYLIALYNKGYITKDTVISYARNKDIHLML